MKEYEQGWADAYDEVQEDLKDDNAAERPPRKPDTAEETEIARVEVDRQIAEHVAEREHGEAESE